MHWSFAVSFESLLSRNRLLFCFNHDPFLVPNQFQAAGQINAAWSRLQSCLFDDVLEHVLRIDNVLRHPMGHMLLVGEAGAGKTVLSRFVAWINGLSIYQIKANRNYTLEQFDEDLRGLMRRVAVDGENICFIFDESNVLSSAFLERMNALLASGEVPGLFEGDELTQLLSACRDAFSGCLPNV